MKGYQKKIKTVTNEILAKKKVMSSTKELEVLETDKDTLVAGFKAYEKEFQESKKALEKRLQEAKGKNLEAKREHDRCERIRYELDEVNHSLSGILESCDDALIKNRGDLIESIEKLKGAGITGWVGVVDYGDVSVINFICMNCTALKGVRVIFGPKKQEFLPTFNKLVSIVAGASIDLGPGKLCHLRIDEDSGTATFSVADGGP